MKILRSHRTIKKPFQRCVVTIGNFDGMHVGHQALLNETKRQAKQLGLKSCVILFEPHPKEYFIADKPPARLMSFKEKVLFLRHFGIDQVLCLRFDKNLASIKSDAFVEEVLVKGLAAQAIIVGYDFRYGYHRAGDLTSLKLAGEKYGFSVTSEPPMSLNDQIVSSTLVRHYLEAGKFDQVAELLGRRYLFSGRVCHGQGVGKQIGCPTANISLKYRVMPVQGVFAAVVEDDKGDKHWSAVSVGYRPYVGGGERLIEAHLIDYNDDLYGKVISVDIRQRLRDQWDFPSNGALRAQIHRDIASVRAYFDQGEG